MSKRSTETANAGRNAPGVRRVQTDDGDAVRRRAGIGRSAIAGILLLVAAVVVTVDLVTKQWAENALVEGAARPLLGEFLQLRLIYNSGAAWGMGSGITPVVTCLQIAICIGAVVFAVRAVRSWSWALAIGLIVGGAVGNIHDRLLREPGPFLGRVVDFLELPHWPIFNVADIAVTSGAVLIVLLGLFGAPADPGAPVGDPGAEDAAEEGRAR